MSEYIFVICVFPLGSSSCRLRAKEVMVILNILPSSQSAVGKRESLDFTHSLESLKLSFRAIVASAAKYYIIKTLLGNIFNSYSCLYLKRPLTNFSKSMTRHYYSWFSRFLQELGVVSKPPPTCQLSKWEWMLWSRPLILIVGCFMG